MSQCLCAIYAVNAHSRCICKQKGVVQVPVYDICSKYAVNAHGTGSAFASKNVYLQCLCAICVVNVHLQCLCAICAANAHKEKQKHLISIVEPPYG